MIPDGLSPQDHAIRLTIFRDFKAQTKHEESLPIAKLINRIALAKAPRKDALHWLKMARFGELRTEKNSLRHDRNVLAITGIEGDYDGEEISFADAVRILQTAHVQAVGSVRVRAGKYNLRGRIDGQSVQAASRMAITVAV